MVLPLNEKQLAMLPQNIDMSHKPFRVLCNKMSVNICTGDQIGGNIINQYVYWDRPKEFSDLVLQFLVENNPNDVFKVVRFGSQLFETLTR